ncbi:helix-turn-helix transcriptional regulator [Streptosporangium sp. NPDC051022]|uniref:helix-turn-helix domain-containing protein n=1 Tax=Streptosporangium sp. NPDC051022 TaxID=3155752 RepID=UPI0034471FEF
MPSQEEFEAWAAQLVGVIAGEIRRYRQRQGLSVQQLSDQIAAEYGMQIKRSVLSNLELGHRSTISVVELLILAKVLRVPPLLLLFPLGRQESVEILPDYTAEVWQAARWFTSEKPFPPKLACEAGELQLPPEDVESWEHGATPARAYREHDWLINQHSRAVTNASRARYTAAEDHKQVQDAQRKRDLIQEGIKGETPPSDKQLAILTEASIVLRSLLDRQEMNRRYCDAECERARELEKILAGQRRQMRQQGLIPPLLGPDLEHLDELIPDQ